MKNYKFLSHTADIYMIAYGHTLEELFSNALLGFYDIIKPIVSKQKTIHQTRLIDINADTTAYLLVEFLNECLYLFDTYHEYYSNIKFINFINSSKEQATLKAELTGFEIVGRNGPEIKAVTYHELKLKQKNNLWEAHVIFDI